MRKPNVLLQYESVELQLTIPSSEVVEEAEQNDQHRSVAEPVHVNVLVLIHFSPPHRLFSRRSDESGFSMPLNALSYPHLARLAVFTAKLP